VELRIAGVPAGLGDPVFGKLDARLAGALCSLGAVKGIEFGKGFEAARLRGSEFNDQMRDGGFVSNNAGGILGGISTGHQIVMRIAVRPTPSISKPQRTCDKAGNNIDIEIEGRHDPCIVPRIVPVTETMAALVILDAWQIQQRLRPDWGKQSTS
jgi:chorismate synthase